MSQQILVVEDEQKLSRSLVDYLENEQFSCHALSDGALVVDWMKNNSPDLILLDLMLPNKDGISICREIREHSNVPIIMLTARVDEIDRLLGLELGADDYICKPYSLREVGARIKAVLRRFSAVTSSAARVSQLRIDKKDYQIYFGDRNMELTAVEFNLLETMSAHAGKIFTRDQLIERAYDDNRIVSDRTVDSHIKKLRKKLAEVAPEVQFIHSIYGVGYKFELDA